MAALFTRARIDMLWKKKTASVFETKDFVDKLAP